ncbi:MAG TPA: hypothetical protein VMD05_01685 [Candidatus Nanoarchaeia archaeon]|nr:hypothetical protein [Candidatus Nanoarchaeia archaeon]
MVEIKWTAISEVNPKGNYFAYAAYAIRKSAWSYFSYLVRASKVQKQLSQAKGLIGFTAKLGFFNRQVIQLAVFENENALRDFAHTGQHANCMEKTKQSLKSIKKTTWNILGQDIPPKIDDAVMRIENVDGR